MVGGGHVSFADLARYDVLVTKSGSVYFVMGASWEMRLEDEALTGGTEREKQRVEGIRKRKASRRLG